MHSSQTQTPFVNALKRWEEYSSRIPGHLDNADKIIDKHSQLAFTEKDIQEVEASLQIMEKIEKGIIFHRKQFLKLKTSHAHLITLLNQFDNMLDMKSNQIRGYVLMLNKVIAHKKMCASKACSKKENNKKAELLLKQAAEHISIAIEIFKSTRYRLEENPEKGLEELNAEIDSLYKTYLLKKAGLFLEAQFSFKKARETPNIDIAYNIYETIATEAKEKKEFLIQFQAYYEQGILYGDAYKKQIMSFVGQEHINAVRKQIHKMSDSFEKAINALSALDNLQDPYISRTCKTMQIDFLVSAKQFFNLCSQIKKDWPQKLELLKEAQRFLACGNSLPHKDEDKNTDYTDLGNALSKEIKRLEAKIAENKKIADDLAIKSVKIQEQEKKYHELFQEMLKSFPSQKKPKAKNQPSHNYIFDASEYSESPAGTPEEVWLVTIDYKWQPQPIKKTNFLLSYEENIRLLDLAKKSANIFEQIRVSINLAEYHKIKALRTERYKQKINQTINNLEKAKIYLTDILEKIATHKVAISSKQEGLNLMEDWSRHMLIHIKDSLARALSHQAITKMKFEKETQCMKEYLTKLGKWKKNKKYHLQYSTRKREELEKSINKIKKLDDEAFILLKDFLLNKMPQSPIFAENYLNRKKMVDTSYRTLHSFFGSRFKVMNSKSKHLSRSISYGDLFAKRHIYRGSTFDPIEIELKEYKRKGAGGKEL